MPACVERSALRGVQALSQDPAGGVEVVNPICESDWDGAVRSFSDATAFHSSAWARVLADTYGFLPLYLRQRSGDGRVTGLLPLMEVGGLLRGGRGLGLPFTDACPPLLSEDGPVARTRPAEVDSLATLAPDEPLLAAALRLGRQRRWRSLELRHCTRWTSGRVPASVSFFGHTIDLRGGDAVLEARCTSPVRRALKKAGRASLRVHFGDDLWATRAFFELHCLTRRRHGQPPQPFAFFGNLQRHVFGSGLGFVALALLGDQPVAGGVFLLAGQQAIYKFGASDQTSQLQRSNNMMMWEAIRRCARLGCTALDLGRTSLGNEGLRRFKLGWGAAEHRLDYVCHDLRTNRTVPTPDRADGWHTQVFRRLPVSLGRLVGAWIYRYAA